MALPMLIASALKKVILGDTALPQEFTIALRAPQTEVEVRLEFPGTLLDVTERCTIACCEPLFIGVSIDGEASVDRSENENAVLRFQESSGLRRELGSIRLARSSSIPFDGRELILFSVLDSRNCCLPKFRLWMHYLPQAFSNWRKFKSFDVRMSSRDIRATQVGFIRPHPLMLCSVMTGHGGNIFPMNLMGELGRGYVAFALKDSRRPAHLIETARRLALSSVPMPLCSVAFKLAANHTRDAIDWEQLPFALDLSNTLRIPIPASAPRVRELEVERIERLGSHSLFVARTLSDDRRSDEPQVHIIHGFYQYWRLRGRKAALRSSIAEDGINKYS